jgi:hypothetical protein
MRKQVCVPHAPTSVSFQYWRSVVSARPSHSANALLPCESIVAHWRAERFWKKPRSLVTKLFSPRSATQRRTLVTRANLLLPTSSGVPTVSSAPSSRIPQPVSNPMEISTN